MRRSYCDICCRELKYDEPVCRDDLGVMKRAYLEAHRKGRFYVVYSRAVVNKDGDVTHFREDYEFALCDECRDRIEKVIWAEVGKMTAEVAGKEVPNTFIAPQFPQVPDVEESCCPVQYTNG